MSDQLSNNRHRILRAINFIEENLGNEIDLKQIAAESTLSEFHFHRLFHLLVGETPLNYLRKRRLHEASAKIIPKHEYAVFTNSGSADTLKETSDYINGTYVPHKNYKAEEDFDFELYTCYENGNDIIKICTPISRKEQTPRSEALCPSSLYSLFYKGAFKIESIYRS